MEVRPIAVRADDGDIELTIAEAGAGGRPLLLLHGFTGAKEDFTEWLDRLAGLGWHAVAVDQRGHGESHKPDDEGSYSFEVYVGDLLGLINALGWQSATVLGHSMGGVVLQLAALRSPERFDALVLMDTSHRALNTDSGIVELAALVARTEGMAALLAAMEAFSGEDPAASEIGRRLAAARPEYKAFSDNKLLTSSPAMYAAMVRAMTDRVGTVDRLHDLRRLTLPTLVLVGEHDAAFVKPSRRLADAIPGAELVVLSGGGHAPQFEAPEEWWSALTGFLGRLKAAPSS